jgi:bacterial/archaeal transporter family-2 protein
VPGPPSPPPPGAALTLAFLSGAAIAVQAYVNGRLASELGSTELAATVNNLVGLGLLIAVGVATGALARAWAAVRRAGRPRWWHLLGGPAGALLVYTTAKAAPEVGVALLTVAIVGGQTAGGLAVDGVGLSPAGRRSPTPARLLGVAVALLAVGVAATGSGGDLDVPLLALAVLAGAGSALQQAANGQLRARTGEPVAAATVNFVLGAAVLVVVALAATGGDPPNGWSAPAPLWIGGLLGMFVVVVAAWAVASLGVLRLTLAVVSGQSAGALVVDLIAPAPGESVTIATVLGVALTIVAVVISGRGRSTG